MVRVLQGFQVSTPARRHPALPHFAAGEWDWLRGALSTVDRSYGFLDHFFHHIADTHVRGLTASYSPMLCVANPPLATSVAQLCFRDVPQAPCCVCGGSSVSADGKTTVEL